MQDPSANPTSPLISLSIVSHGDAAALETLLRSLARYEPATRLQIIVTDNLGRDLPALDPSPWNSFTMVRNPRPQGYARNHNAAFRLARGRYYCVLNPDIVFVEPIFEPLLVALESGEGDIVAPLIIDSGGSVQDSFRSLPQPIELIQRRARHATQAAQMPRGEFIHPDWIAGICMLTRTETFSKLGGFDARYRLYFEDVDLCTRARLLGLSILVDSHVHLLHDARRASRTEAQFLLWHLQSAFRFYASRVYWQARGLQKCEGALGATTRD